MFKHFLVPISNPLFNKKELSLLSGLIELILDETQYL